MFNISRKTYVAYFTKWYSNNNGLHYVVFLLINYQRSESRFPVCAGQAHHTHTVIMVKVSIITLYMGLYTSPRPQVSTGGLAAGYLE